MKQTFIFCILFLTYSVYAQTESYTEKLLLMGSRFEITAEAQDKFNAYSAINAAIEEIKRIEFMLSEYQDSSQVSKINRMAGVSPVKVSQELFDLVRRCIKISELTDGAFDITWATAANIWHFDGSMTVVPDQNSIEKIKNIIGYQNIILNFEDTTVFLQYEGMKIGFGAIGKGYAAANARKVMEEMNIENGVVIAGGDLVTWGTPSNSDEWKIGIANPENPNEAIAWLNVTEMAVVTSGNYEKFVIIDGVRYTHIIDPRSCMPVRGLRSATIICSNAELADALATAVFVMGVEAGLNLINQLKGIECLLIDEENKMYPSSGLNLNFYNVDEQHNIHTVTIGQ